MQIEKLTFRDLDSLKELQPEGWSDIIPVFEFYLNSPFCQPIKALSGNSIRGIGTTIIHKSSAWLAHIIVQPEFRNRGIGGLLTKSLVEAIDFTKYPTVSLIATPSGEPVYRKFGFQRETDYLFFRNENYKPPVVQDPLVIDAAHVWYNEILKLDRKASGEDRAGLLEPYLNKIKIYYQNEKLLGFYAPDFGDGLVIAEHEPAGLELLKLKLQAKPFSVLPSENESAILLLQDLGFQHFRKGTRMIIGEKNNFQPKMLFSRAGGSLG